MSEDLDPDLLLHLEDWERLNLWELFKRHEEDLPLDVAVARGLELSVARPQSVVSLAALVTSALLREYLGWPDCDGPTPEEEFQMMVRAFLAGFRAGVIEATEGLWHPDA